MRFIILFPFVLGMLLSLTSCIEILDDISLNKDGSGTLKYNVNLSASKVKINSVLALDSLEGKRVPELVEIEDYLRKFVFHLDQEKGISNVVLESDYDNFMFKLSCDFVSLERLQNGIKAALKQVVKNPDDVKLSDQDMWIFFAEGRWTRSIPDLEIPKKNNLSLEEIEDLKKGSYISITRFEYPVKSVSNPKAVIAKNKLAVMVRENAYAVLENPNVLENTIMINSEK